MDTEQLQKWLHLPPGTWPPDHYTLLGLSLGQGDADEIELRGLERMDRLRHYQIRHPELVTEGMNRLAHAMVCLTESESRRVYDTQLGITPPQVAVEAASAEPEAARPPSSEPVIIPELVEPSPTVEEPPTEHPEADQTEASVQANLDLPSPEITAAQARLQARRFLYQQLVQWRAILRVWNRLAPYLSDPSHPLRRRPDALALARALQDLAEALPEVEPPFGHPGTPGGLIVGLSRQTLLAQTFRELLLSQRQALAQDWEAGRRLLRQQAKTLRQQVRASRQQSWVRRVLLPIYRELWKHPEWVLMVLGIWALGVSVVRSLSEGSSR